MTSALSRQPHHARSTTGNSKNSTHSLLVWNELSDERLVNSSLKHLISCQCYPPWTPSHVRSTWYHPWFISFRPNQSYHSTQLLHHRVSLLLHFDTWPKLEQGSIMWKVEVSMGGLTLTWSHPLLYTKRYGLLWTSSMSMTSENWPFQLTLYEFVKEWWKIQSFYM